MAAVRDPATGLTPQQEQFCQELARGADQAEAYRLAFPRSKKWQAKSVWERASKLAADTKVASRLAAIAAIARDEAERKLRFGLPEAMAQADEAYACARAFGQGGAMVAAVTLKAKLAGLFSGESPPVLPLGLSPELARELVARIEKIKAERTALSGPSADAGRLPAVIDGEPLPAHPVVRRARPRGGRR